MKSTQLAILFATLALGLAVAAAPAGAANPAACIGCHGAKGEGQGPNPNIADMSKSAFIEAMNDYKSGERNHPAMNALSSTLSEEEIVELAAHFTAGEEQSQSQSDAQSPMRRTAEACVKSWVQADADEDGTITQTEAAKADETLFDRMDADGNGSISVAEWNACAIPSLDDIQSALADERLGTKTLAQQSPSDDRAASAPSNKMTTQPGGDVATGDLTGLGVYSTDGTKVGTVANADLDGEGNAKSLRINVGDYLALGGKTVEVSAEQFIQAEDRIELRLTEAQVAELPEATSK